MLSESLLFDVKGHVAFITLNRPDQRNAINQKMGSALIACLRRSFEDADIRVVVLTGAGADLKERASTGG